jgi:hypothetical protein
MHNPPLQQELKNRKFVYTQTDEIPRVGQGTGRWKIESIKEG